MRTVLPWPGGLAARARAGALAPAGMTSRPGRALTRAGTLTISINRIQDYSIVAMYSVPLYCSVAVMMISRSGTSTGTASGPGPVTNSPTTCSASPRS